jgi:excisionase family DNA binding protein
MEDDVIQAARKRAYSINTTAGMIDICRDGVYAAIHAGQLRARKFGKRTLILDEDLMAFLQSLPEVDLSETANPSRKSQAASAAT